jgi:hypothetical protein
MRSPRPLRRDGLLLLLEADAPKPPPLADFFVAANDDVLADD